jgi:hypothetical protein
VFWYGDEEDGPRSVAGGARSTEKSVVPSGAEVMAIVVSAGAPVACRIKETIGKV